MERFQKTLLLRSHQLPGNIHAKARMFPAPHLANDVLIYPPFSLQHSHNTVRKYSGKHSGRDTRHSPEATIPRKSSPGNQRMKVRVKIEKIAGGVDGDKSSGDSSLIRAVSILSSDTASDRSKKAC